MRPILACLITVVLISGVSAYIRFADSVRRPPIEISIDYAGGEYSVEIERTFDCEGDPILGTESLKVLFKGETVFARNEPIPTTEPVEIRPLEGVESGENEIYVSATMSESTLGLGVLKVTVKRNDIPIMEKMLASTAGLMEVGGPVVFEVLPQNEKTDQHQH